MRLRRLTDELSLLFCRTARRRIDGIILLDDLTVRTDDSTEGTIPILEPDDKIRTVIVTQNYMFSRIIGTPEKKLCHNCEILSKIWYNSITADEHIRSSIL